VMSIRVEDARAGVAGFGCNLESGHPLITAFMAARGLAKPEDMRPAIREILIQYYANVRPRSAADVLGLHEHDAPGLAGTPLQSWVFPWSELSIADTTIMRNTCLVEEGLAERRKLSLSDGHTFYGPVSQAKLDLETQRIAGLCQSFARIGFRPSQREPIDVVALRSGRHFRWLVVQGQHRIAACAAFGIESVEARIVRIIRREDAEYWPHVASGTFEIDAAVKCFDRIFAGEAFPAAAPWSAMRQQGGTSRNAASAEGGRHRASSIPETRPVPGLAERSLAEIEMNR
jgi:hypothetical protein